jgi:hypothetical protein
MCRSPQRSFQCRSGVTAAERTASSNVTGDFPARVRQDAPYVARVSAPPSPWSSRAARGHRRLGGRPRHLGRRRSTLRILRSLARRRLLPGGLTSPETHRSRSFGSCGDWIVTCAASATPERRAGDAPPPLLPCAEGVAERCVSAARWAWPREWVLVARAVWAARSWIPPGRTARRGSGGGELVSVELEEVVGRGQQPPFRSDG